MKGSGEANARGQRPELRSRSVQQHDERVRRVRSAPKRVGRSFTRLARTTSPLALLLVLVVLLILVVSIAAPLRNYTEQRKELKAINAEIQAQEQRRDELDAQLKRYRSDDYVREQARTRLGLIEPGESAYRIISPRIRAGNPESQDAPGSMDLPDTRPWYEQLWDSISVPESTPTGEPATGDALPVPTVGAPAPR